MTFKIILPVAFAALAMAAPAIAQDFTLSGTVVPADNVQLLKDHCTELRRDAVGKGDDGASATDPTNTDSTAAVDFELLDIASVTLSQCRDGGFIIEDDTTTTAN